MTPGAHDCTSAGLLPGETGATQSSPAGTGETDGHADPQLGRTNGQSPTAPSWCDSTEPEIANLSINSGNSGSTPTPEVSHRSSRSPEVEERTEALGVGVGLVEPPASEEGLCFRSAELPTGEAAPACDLVQHARAVAEAGETPVEVLQRTLESVPAGSIGDFSIHRGEDLTVPDLMPDGGKVVAQGLLLEAKNMGGAPGRCAARLGPIRTRCEHWASNAATTRAAIWKRQVKPHKDMGLSKQEEESLLQLVRKVVRGLVTRSAVRAIVLEYPEIFAMASRQWTEKRMREAIESTLGQVELHMLVSFSIKSEVLADTGKEKPRLLQADGDTGQVLALQTIFILEKLLFAQGARLRGSIKYAPYHVVMDALIKDCQVTTVSNEKLKETLVVMGDGSSWDATVSRKLRSMVEDVFIDAVADIMQQGGWGAAADRAHRGQNRGKWTFARSKDGLAYRIPSCRRSGHRGTSCLNGLTNLVLWAWVISPRDGHHMCLNSGYVCLRNRAGNKGWCYSIFEGDDSLLRMEKRLYSEDEAFDLWHRLGFHMKLEAISEGLAEFCGSKLDVVKGSCIAWTPDPTRQIDGGTWTVSSALVNEALSNGISMEYRSLACTCVMAYVRNNLGSELMREYFMAIARWWDSPTAEALFEGFAEEVPTSVGRGSDALIRKHYPEVAGRLSLVQHIISPFEDYWVCGVDPEVDHGESSLVSG